MTLEEKFDELLEAAAAIVHSDSPVMFLVGEEGASTDDVNDYWNRLVDAVNALRAPA